MIQFIMHVVIMTAMAVMLLGRNTLNSFVFCNFNKITMGQGSIVFIAIAPHVFYLNKVVTWQNCKSALVVLVIIIKAFIDFSKIVLQKYVHNMSLIPLRLQNICVALFGCEDSRLIA